jgi:hypothetical protein
MDVLAESVRDGSGIPLVWAGAAAGGTGIDFGDALSPVMVVLCSGQKVRRLPARSAATRLSAVGTIGRSIEGGRVVVWGTGCAALPNPGAPGTELILRATRGPLSRALLGGDGRACAYGDPAWLLPWFYRPEVPKRWDLGVLLPPAEPRGKAPGAGHPRQAIPAELADHVRLIHPLTAPGIGGLRDKLDEILACRRIVSASLHGLVIAETYGIPCLFLAADGPAPGLARLPTTADGGLGPHIADLYAGMRVSSLPVYGLGQDQRTDWAGVMRAVDAAWNPVWLREDDLLESFPLPVRTLSAPPGGTVFDHPLLRALALDQEPGDQEPGDQAPGALEPAEARPARAGKPAAASAPVGLRDWVEQNGVVPLSWAAGSPARPFPNLGDALSAVIVGAMTGLPVQRRKFRDPGERLVAVGTIGHGLRHGGVHLWGTSLDPKRNAVDPAEQHFRVPPDTRFVVHATRGRFTAARLREEGVATPAVYGDPVWFLPRLTAGRPVPPKYDLGVVLHVSELEQLRPGAGVLESYRRYDVPPGLAGSVRIINTFSEQGLDAVLAKVDEIRACRRIASISFHGLVIAETYGIPNVWFKPSPGGRQMLDVEDEASDIDHRMRDWYSGTSKLRLPVYGSDREKPTAWEELMRWIDSSWTPLSTDAAALFAAFPLPVSVSWQDAAWPIAPAVAESLQML